MNEKNDLRPCPFCKSDNIQPFEKDVAYEGRMTTVFFALCNGCGAEGSCHNGVANLTMEEALAAWNNRDH